MLHSYFQDILLVLGFATLIVTLFNSLKLPPLVGFLGAGVIIGPNGLGLISSLPGAQIVSELGVIFLLFTIGLEFSFQKLSEYKKSFLFLGFLQVFLTVGIVFSISYFVLNKTVEQSLLWGFLISLSSTAIVLKLLHEKRELETLHGHSTISVLLSQDILVLPMLLILPSLAGQSELEKVFQTSALFTNSIKLVVIVSAMVLLAKKVIPYVFEKIVKTNSRELFFFFLIFFCFGLAFIFEKMQLSVSLGAFVAGLIISESPYGKQATSDFIPLRDNFLGMFFISIGMLLDLPFIINNFMNFFLLGTGVFALKISLIYLTMRLNYITHSVALMTSLLLFQVGEFSFVLATEATKLSLLSAVEMQYFVAISVISLALTPFFFQFAPRLSSSKKFRSFFPKNVPSIFPKSEFKVDINKKLLDNHTIIIGYGLAGQSLAETFKSLNIKYVAIEFNPESFRKHVQNHEENILFGDASSIEILEKAHLEKAQQIVVTASGTTDHLQSIIRSIRHLRSDIPIILRIQYLRNAFQIPKDANTTVVVAEFETTLEVLAKTLKLYEIPEEQINVLISEHRVKYKDQLGVL